jgi:predicted metalloprotease with PDZ domain
MVIRRLMLAASLACIPFAGTDAARAAVFHAVPSLAGASDPAVLAVDARDAARGIMTVRETIPVRPGPFTLVYPKWIPGEHGPTGPLGDLASLRISAGGKTVTWRRDPVDMYAFHVDVPQGASALDVAFTVLLNSPEPVSDGNLAILNWNRALLYQAGVDSRQWYVRASLRLPHDWDFGTALPVASRNGDTVVFNTVTLATLVDSPLDMGRYSRHIVLWRGSDGATYELDAFADAPQDLDFPEAIVSAYRRVAPEAIALYGARHWIHYHALLTLSDAIGFEGIEHHSSSDDRAPADFMTNPKWQFVAGDLLTHEFSHSWNGKYRRPADLTTPNFQVPMKTDLLWVYEGMNQYLGDLISFRAGIRKPSDYPEYLASIYARMDTEPGRDTTPLIDLTTGAPYLYETGGEYPSIRRTAGDFYTEGELLWLDADTIIRTLSHGTKSLDTFLHLYAGPPSGPPATITYTRAQIEELLNRVQPYDWHAFFQRYVYEVAPHPPTDELARSGWKLVYTEKPNAFIEAQEALRHVIDDWYSIGARLTMKGKVLDVREGSPAWEAGLAPGMEIEAVNGQAFSPEVLSYELKQAEHSGAPIEMIVEGSGWFKQLAVNYHGGPLYPHLVRIPGTQNLLARIMAPHAGR